MVRGPTGAKCQQHDPAGALEAEEREVTPQVEWPRPVGLDVRTKVFKVPGSECVGKVQSVILTHNRWVREVTQTAWPSSQDGWEQREEFLLLTLMMIDMDCRTCKTFYKI